MLNMPYLVTDWNFQILWSNACLRSQYAYLNGLHSLDSLLSGYNKAQLLSQLEREKSLTLACKLPMVNMTLTLSAQGDPLSPHPEYIVIAFTGAPSVKDVQGLSLTAFNQALRSPIRGLFGSIALLEHHLDDEYIPQLQSMNKECYQMLRACISISEYTEYLNGSAQLKKEAQDLCRWLKEQLDPLIPMLERNGFHLSYELPAEEIICFFDSSKLSLVLLSLISNSCLFCDKENNIKISVDKNQHAAHILVSDEGYGIPAEIMPRIMEPYFSRGLDENETPGIGLGLPLSRAIIEHHGGTLTLQSVQDEGTTVALSLPLDASPLPSMLPLHASAPRYNNDRYAKHLIFLSMILPAEEL